MRQLHCYFRVTNNFGQQQELHYIERQHEFSATSCATAS